MRFARLRMEKRHNYVRKVAETAVQLFISGDKVNVAGLVLAGSADFKTELSQSDMFDQVRERELPWQGSVCEIRPFSVHGACVGLPRLKTVAGDPSTHITWLTNAYNSSLWGIQEQFFFNIFFLKSGVSGAGEMAQWVRAPHCSSEGKEFKARQPHGGSQPSVTKSDSLFWSV